MSNTESKTTYFLATTAIEDFWDKTLPIVFLGPWCCRYSRKNIWSALPHHTLAEPLAEVDDLIPARKKVHQDIEELLPHLMARLNELHQENHNLRYWRILLESWLRWYVCVLYERYLAVKNALLQFPQLTTIGLAEDSFIVPNNAVEFATLVQLDDYNLQIYTQILRFFKLNFPVKSHAIMLAPTKKKFSFKTCLQSIGKLIQRCLSNRIYLRTSYLPRYAQTRLFLHSLGKIQPLLTDIEIASPIYLNQVARKNLTMLYSTDDEFKQLLLHLLPKDIPTIFVENYKKMRTQTLLQLPRNPRAILSANWYFDDVLSFWAAHYMERGTRLLSVQHGGNYGSTEFTVLSEHFKDRICDKFYTWGWEPETPHQKFKPMPAVKLVGIHKKIQLKCLPAKEKFFLYGLTSRSRYALIYDITYHDFARYLQEQILFLEHLSINVKRKLRIRPHYQDFGWDIIKRLQDCDKDLFFSQWDVPFYSVLQQAELYICDHISTTFIEAIALNQPVVAYWDRKVFNPRLAAIPYYDLLCEADILSDSPQQAATVVNTIQNDVAAWWFNDKRQQLRKKFCDRYAKIDDQDKKIWLQELMAYSHES